MVEKDVPLQKIPFNNDPLTKILQSSFAGKLTAYREPNSITRMFVNVSPTKYDTAVTNRSLKFAQQTGRIKTKTITKDFFQILKRKTLIREKFFKQNNL
jgi:hypothetical protein